MPFSKSKNRLDEISKLNNELVDTQRELHKKNAELEATNNYKNEILGIAAHDLRNPISVIQMYSKFLNQNLQNTSPADQQKLLAKIISSSKFMLSLLNDLLDLAQVESGKLTLNLDSVDLNEAIQNNIDSNQVIADSKQIKIKLKLHSSIPILQMDRNKFEQVMNNIVGNAIKYSPAGSTIEISTELKEKEVLIEIRDEGPGIPPEEIGKLFKPFSRTSVQSTAGEKSTGLGLTIAKKLVEGHGGKIWVESKVGEGTSFFIEIPLNQPIQPST